MAKKYLTENQEQYKLPDYTIFYLYKAKNIFRDLIHHSKSVLVLPVRFLKKVEIDQKSRS